MLYLITFYGICSILSLYFYALIIMNTPDSKIDAKELFIAPYNYIKEKCEEFNINLAGNILLFILFEIFAFIWQIGLFLLFIFVYVIFEIFVFLFKKK